MSRYNNALYLSGRAHIRISNITFRYYGQGSYAKAIYIDTSSDIVVEKCLFSSNDLGISIKRKSHRNVIQDNEFKDGLSCVPGFSDPASGDYTLSSGSPLIDRGLIIPGINDDYAGAAPDTGAFENRDNQGQPGEGHHITPVIMLLLDN
ncbi:MAG: right-handed parallel beta-helix repeat-containing protein [Deltaproteobacteria bacterium]|nr:right-handed parallel beta-helix repeat-containing protein [Deltaproteobacteria bacterium]